MLKIAVVLFYLSAGIIKFNSDWLSGQALLRPFLFSGKWLEWACAFVIVLELVLSPALLLGASKYKTALLGVFILFHVYSWPVVGYYYPVLMFLFLMIFFLSPEEVDLRVLKKINIVAITLYCVFQMIPLFYSLPALSGQGRVFSLNMLDAYSQCQTSYFVRSKNKTVEYSPVYSEHGVRIHCDPAVILQHLNTTCRSLYNDEDFIDIDVDHQVREKSSWNKIYQFTYKNACSRPLKLNIFWKVIQDG